MFAEYLPELPTRSLYDVLAQLGLTCPQHETGRVSVFDPCASRNRPDLNARIRQMTQSAGYETVPLRYEGKYAQCCSWGGQIRLTNPPYAQWLAQERAHENDLPYVCYCTNCRDILSRQGKPARHILDLLFGLNGWDRTGPRIDQRLSNRAAVKQHYQPDPPNATPGPHLDVPEELLEKLDQEYLWIADIQQVIAAAEASGRYFIRAEDSVRIAHGPAGRTTLWVEYQPQGDGYLLLNAYSHRMQIESDYTPDVTQQAQSTPTPNRIVLCQMQSEPGGETNPFRLFDAQLCSGYALLPGVRTGLYPGGLGQRANRPGGDDPRGTSSRACTKSFLVLTPQPDGWGVFASAIVDRVEKIPYNRAESPLFYQTKRS